MRKLLATSAPKAAPHLILLVHRAAALGAASSHSVAARKLPLRTRHISTAAATMAQFPKEVDEAKDLICDLCRNLYAQGAVSGTGGGISIKVGEYIVMAPSGVQKERMQPDDMFVLDAKGEVLHTPAPKPPPARPPKLSECSPLFMSAYELRGAGAVIHSHSMNAFLATVMEPDATEFKCTHIEMIKGIEGHGFYGNCIVPIIENTARECELTDRLRAAIKAYPQSNAVLVRRHGEQHAGHTQQHAHAEQTAQGGSKSS